MKKKNLWLIIGVIIAIVLLMVWLFVGTIRKQIRWRSNKMYKKLTVDK